MARIESTNFYVAERDQNYKNEPTVWVVAKDESKTFIFTKRHDFWVLTNQDHKIDYFDYEEVRELIAVL